MSVQSRFDFCLGTRVMFAAGLARSAGDEAARLGGSRVLLVTDSGVQRAGLLVAVAASLAARVASHIIFDDVPPNSSRAAVEAGAALARGQGSDLLVAVGGGSVIDTAKGIRLLLGSGGALGDHSKGARVTEPLLPLIALPTTAGTGAEVSPQAYIYDEASHRRLHLRHAALAPTLALLDPELTLTLPPPLSAATGMHTLSHAIEAFVSPHSSPFGDSLALYAIDLVATYLRDVTHAADDLNARSAMLVAASMAGAAFVNAAPGIVSVMVEAVSGGYNIHPGAVQSILLPFGMQFNSIAVPNRYQRIARALGIVAGGRSEVDVIGDSVTEVRSMVADCNLPLRLRDVGIGSDDLPRMAAAAAADPRLAANPRPADAEQIVGILNEAW